MSATRLWVGGFTRRVQKEEVTAEFQEYGKIVDIWIAFDPGPPGYCFVEFETEAEAQAAIDGKHQQMCLGCKVQVQKSKKSGFLGKLEWEQSTKDKNKGNRENIKAKLDTCKNNSKRTFDSEADVYRCLGMIIPTDDDEPASQRSSTPVKKVRIQEDLLAVEISTDGESSDVEAVPPSQFIPQLDESPVLTSAVQEARKRGSKTMKVTQKQPAPNRTATPQEDVRLSKTGTSQKVVRKSKKTVSPQEVDRIPDPLTSGKKKAKVVKITNRGVAKKTDGHVIKAGATPPLPINTVVDNTTQESQAGLGLAEDTPSYGIFLGDGTNNSTVTKPTSSAQSSGHYSGQHNMGEWAVEKINCKSRLQGKKGKRESEDMQGGEGEIYL